ncbi:MAG: hypothetical protein ACI4V2_05460 [Alloprevotella sp.]
MSSKNLLLLKWAYVAVWAIAGVWALLSEMGVCPTDYISGSPSTDYTLNLLAFALTIGGFYLGLRLPAFKWSVKKLTQEDDEKARGWYRTMAGLRTLLLGLPVVYDVVIYYAAPYATSVKYCLLIALVGLLFGWPSKGEFETLRKKSTQPSRP